VKLVYSYGATPLDPDEIEGLIPEHPQDQRDLNEWEQANILEAELFIKSTGSRRIFMGAKNAK